MKLKKKVFFLTAIALFYVPFFAAAVENPEAAYEKYYPKYVDSKEPLDRIRLNDISILRKANMEIGLQPVPSPVVMPYGSRDIEQLNIYRLPGGGARTSP